MPPLPRAIPSSSPAPGTRAASPKAFPGRIAALAGRPLARCRRLAVGLMLAALGAGLAPPLLADEAASRVVTIPTRPGVGEKILYRTVPGAKATLVLLAGGHGGLQLADDGAMKWGSGNFLVRSRERFAARGFNVAVLDAPSDRQSWPFLEGFRQTPEHAADVAALIAWLRRDNGLPVWLVGTSRGTQSAAYAATRLAPAQGPDGLVLTSTILTDTRNWPVPSMALDTLAIPVLVVHHRYDGCKLCNPAELPRLMERLGHPGGAPRELVLMEGGTSQGDPCEARAYHGFNGIEDETVAAIAAWIDANGAPRTKAEVSASPR